ncbi:MAG: DNA polymerase III [Spirochaetaceae bacterium]|nr:DNA polymerase III [Spirochaetaceae bacterium]
MFDNLLYQSASIQLEEDIKKGVMPNAILFSGPSASGKLTCALELARILSCTENPKGQWQCTCPACLKHKALANPTLLLAGAKNCTLEIAAAEKALLKGISENATYINAVRYLFVRSIRKLTLRFNPILWEGDDKISKISPVISSIDEILEELNPLRPLGEFSKIEKLCSSVKALCSKLEENFMYDSIPVSQIRKISTWAHFRCETGKKVIIIEKADRMQDSVRNALLKILEEPPTDVLFLLTTNRRSAIMPTILSRVRTYSFSNRTVSQQIEVINRVFHHEVDSEGPHTLELFLQSFLPVDSFTVEAEGKKFLMDIILNNKINISNIQKNCNNFEPKTIFSIFLTSVMAELRNLALNQLKYIKYPSQAMAAELASKGAKKVEECFTNVSIYNQNTSSALELLNFELSNILINSAKESF